MDVDIGKHHILKYGLIIQAEAIQEVLGVEFDGAYDNLWQDDEIIKRLSKKGGLFDFCDDAIESMKNGGYEDASLCIRGLIAELLWLASLLKLKAEPMKETE